MIFVGILLCLAAVNGATVHKRNLQDLDPASIQTFMQLFRTALLDKVAIEMNNTVDMSKQLKTKIDVCKPKIQTMTDNCKACAKSRCGTTPTFLDYLSLANPYTYLQGPLNDMAGKLTDVVDLLGDNASAFLNSMKDLGSSAVGTITDGFTSAFNAMKDSVTALGNEVLNAGNTVIDTAGLIGDGFTDGINEVGHTIENVGSSIGHAIGGIFGKRELDAQTRQCMSKCDTCRPLLLPTKDEMITAVCGGEIVKMNNTMTAMISKIQNVYDSVVDKANPIVTRLQFDPASMNGKMQLTNVHITVRLNGAIISYKTAVPYSMMNMPQTARDMAMEFWGKSH
ncbi:hypothetical protein ACF0H5_012263 [Mactra antiquata]